MDPADRIRPMTLNKIPTTWPDTAVPVNFEALVEPLARWLRSYIGGRVEIYDGLPLGDQESAGALQPIDALTPASIDYALTHQGRDVYDTIIGLAIQLGIEQGRRLRTREDRHLLIER